MIPRAIAKIFDTTERLKEQGWIYELEGQFLEIVRLLAEPLALLTHPVHWQLCLSLPQYNETLNDLLGSGNFDEKKHEIKHEKIGRSTRTTVTDATLGQSQVAGLP
jgi:kinesin family protein C1